MKKGDFVTVRLDQLDGPHTRLLARLTELGLNRMGESRSGTALGQAIRQALSYTTIDVVAGGGRRRDDRFVCASHVRLVQAAQAHARVPGETLIRVQILDESQLTPAFIDANIWHEYLEVVGLHRYWELDSARSVVRAAERALSGGAGGPLEESRPAYLARMLGYSSARLFKADEPSNTQSPGLPGDGQ